MSFFELSSEKPYFHLFSFNECHEDCVAHYHSALEFIFITNGKIEMTINGVTKMLYAGEGCFSDSFQVHFHRGFPNSKAYLLVADKRFFEKFFEENKGSTFPSYFSFERSDLLAALLELYKKTKHWNCQTGAVQGIFETFVYALNEEVALVERKINKNSTLVGKILHYAHTHLSEDLSLARLSAQFGYSREHLSRLIHSYLNEYWNAYVNRIRALAVHEALKREKNCTIMQLATRFGFENSNTFYRAYKKEFGKSPKQ